MNNNLYIDDLNVLGRFGCRVTRGGYNDLLAFPAMKEPEKNDWPEEDGIEVDLSDPKLQPREIAISFLSDSNTQASDLIAYLRQRAAHLSGACFRTGMAAAPRRSSRQSGLSIGDLFYLEVCRGSSGETDSRCV